MFGLCKYKGLFGKPGEGIHQYRAFGVGVVDVLVTILGGAIVGYCIRWFLPWWNVPATIVATFLAGIVVHRVFCVRTAVDKWLFPNAKDS